MADKSNFTPEEWARVVASPMVVGMAITAADPSGLWGMLKESMASGWALMEAKQSATANSLAKAVADDILLPETRTAVRDRMQSQFKGAQLGELKDRAVRELRGVRAILEAKAPAEAPAFKGLAADGRSEGG